MKFAEAALFRVAVSPSGNFRDGVRQGRADARFVRGMWLGKDQHTPMNILSRTSLGVYTTRTLKRVPDSEQKRADLVRRTPWDVWKADRARQLLKHPLSRLVPMAKESDGPSENAGLRRSAKAQDLNPQQFLISSESREPTELIVIQTNGDGNWGRSSQHSQRRLSSSSSSSSKHSHGTGSQDWRTARELRFQA